ncbi:hypothetical protein LMG27952_05884 [Paraburkholderia hiiakae]|uniref:Calcineurin-like phosphoesterase domain-containing protein n=1 Tax=Paraburkholderia hiiakae TaxID=1081782 RepID=A0ABM8P3R0_9BURK|nr:metallophosphoesterase [Paraburkholderia hiiakae]CAD6555648.1 hypothetical protein LMG27952_05884 [Paraburkholderia hiiakae]
MSTNSNTTANPAPVPSPAPPPDPKKLQTRLLNAVKAIQASSTVPQGQKNMVGQLLNEANSQATDLLNGDTTASPVHHVLANVKSLLNNATVLTTPDDHQLVVSSVTDEGDLVGNEKYESLDVGWAEAAACWLEHIPAQKKAPFSNAPQTITISDDVSIAIVGDWGTGVSYRTDGQRAPAGKVADQIRNLNPTYTIHLGDVYYAGTFVEENNNFLAVWPPGSAGSFALNANHDMYSGGQNYFTDTLGNASFDAQKGCSYFALQNKNWLIIGLDTAYYADQMQLYQNGKLDSQQCAFLQATLDSAPGSRIILLTHHNGLTTDGTMQCDFWPQQIAPLLGDREVWWYWGHQHAGAVYTDRGNVHPRCCGHGAIPAGAPPLLASSTEAIWHENRKAPDPLYQNRVYNGFVFLTLSGDSPLNEVFIDEDGTQAYPPPPQ